MTTTTTNQNAAIENQNTTPDSDAVRQYLQGLQSSLCEQLAAMDGEASFGSDLWTRDAGGGGNTRTLAEGAVFEKGGIGFSEVSGNKLPPSASAQRPELAGREWRAMGVSLVMHPRNPHVPTSHMNVRFFRADKADKSSVWWFGGGFDLTPYYAYREDCQHWHQCAYDACAPFGDEHYSKYKAWCDKYFFLKHRNETRGVGGLFFDDYSEGGFEQSFAFMQSVGDHFLKAYLPIVKRRKEISYTDAQRDFQLYRRGRYVEFNLVHDRGTLFGLQSGGRTESILMSMPPQANWSYNYQAEPGSREEALTSEYLIPQDWLKS